MADLVVGLAKSVVEGVLNKAQSAIEEEAKLRQSVQHNLVFIAGEFEMMHSFLNVATEERVRNNVVRTWVRQIRDLAYDVEDGIEFVVHLDNKPIWWRRLRPPCMAASAVPLDEAVAELEQLKARVEDVSRRNSRYSLISDSGSKPSLQQEPSIGTAVGTTADMLAEARDLTKKQVVFGDLTKLITKESTDLGVISVWGTGGEHGMTSIIRKAYQDPEICKKIGCRGWVRLTHPFNPHEFLRSLVDQFYSNCCLQEGKPVDMGKLKGIEAAATPQHVLIQEFMEQVNKKRYLVVLENVTTMGDWDAIRTYLPDSKNGSWIIVSTQQCEIASLCIGHSYQVVELKQYSGAHSVCVFFKEDSRPDKDKCLETNGVMDNLNETSTAGESSHMNGLISYNSVYISKKNAAEEWKNNCCFVERDSEMNQLDTYIANARMNDIHVISVWGIAGVGKSALVRNLYNSLIHTHDLFVNYGWVAVSHPFNLRDFSRSLLSDLIGPHHVMDIRDPIEECCKILERHRCLVVIDDLQSIEEWDLIHSAFVSSPSKSSTIIVITTDASIATHCADKEEAIFNVKGLEAEGSFKLFEKQALMKNESRTLEVSRDGALGELILKCGGIPKVIVAIAEFLAPETVNWMDSAKSVNNRFIQELETNPNFNRLRELFSWMHSYFRTCPDFLKPCIFYLSIFPREERIRRRRLVRRWIAEGYSRDTENSSAEERGEEFFSRLLDLSIIQQPPHSVTTVYNDMKMVLCQINSFVREYIISRQMEENLVFELDGSCTLTTQRRGRHLIIRKSWDRDSIVFENIDFSRLRSLTVYGEWKSSFISDRMRLLRVLDLEDASGVNDKDLKLMVQLLPRLKYLSLRGCSEISQLPSSLGDLRQLETLDIRYTSVVTMPWTITKLRKLQYFRFGTSKPQRHTNLPWLPSMFCRGRQVNSVEVPAGIGKITTLHTLGVVNVNTTRGRAVLKEIKKLTQLRKLGVSGISKKNCKNFFSAISNHGHLKSLSVTIKQDNPGLFDATLVDVPEFSPPKNLQSLKLHGLEQNLPIWITQIQMLTKLDLEMTMLSENDIHSLKDLKLSILRLRIKQLLDGELNFCVMLVGHEVRCYNTVKVLEIFCSSNLNITFGSHALQNLELLKARCCSRSPVPLHFSGLDKLTELREVQIECSQVDTMKRELEKVLDTRHDEARIGNAPKRPVLNVHGLVASSHQ